MKKCVGLNLIKNNDTDFDEFAVLHCYCSMSVYQIFGNDKRSSIFRSSYFCEFERNSINLYNLLL